MALRADLSASAVGTAEEALIILAERSIDILLVDLNLPVTSGLERLKRARERFPKISVITLMQYGTIVSAIEAGQLGARDDFSKPFRVAELRARLDRAVEAIDLSDTP